MATANGNGERRRINSQQRSVAIAMERRRPARNAQFPSERRTANGERRRRPLRSAIGGLSGSTTRQAVWKWPFSGALPFSGFVVVNQATAVLCISAPLCGIAKQQTPASCYALWATQDRPLAQGKQNKYPAGHQPDRCEPPIRTAKSHPNGQPLTATRTPNPR